VDHQSSLKRLRPRVVLHQFHPIVLIMIVYIFAEGYIVIFDVLGAHPCDDLELVIIHDDFEAFSFTDWAPPLSMA